MILDAVFRKFQPVTGRAQNNLRQTFTESLAVDQVAPVGLEMTRAGRRFNVGYTGTAPTGIAPVQAFPTTAAQWAISNNDPLRTHFYEVLGAMLFSGTSGLGGQLLACIFQTPAQQGFVTGLAVQSASRGGLTSQASIRSGVTITTPSLPNWFFVAEQIAGTAQVGPASSICNRHVRACIAVPPTMSLGLAVLAPAGTTPLYLPIAEWIELETELE